MNTLEAIFQSATRIGPEWTLLFGILATALGQTFSRPGQRLTFYLFVLSVVLYLYSLTATAHLVKSGGENLFHGLLFLDRKALLIKQLAGASALIFMVHSRLFSYKYTGEVYLLVLFVLFGVSFLSMTTHFAAAFVALEMISLASYALVSAGKLKTDYETGIKYLLFGATASAITLYGISLLYGVSHALNFATPEFGTAISAAAPVPVQIICFMVMAGFLFKVAAAPFHHWVPEVYENTSTPIVSFLSFAPKAAGFLFIARFTALPEMDLAAPLALVIGLSWVVGNFAALWQNNFKRMLGYSAIAHSGFILVGMVAGPETYGSLFYLIAYLPMTMGAFFLADFIQRKIHTLDIPSMAGLGKKYPLLGMNAVVVLVSLVGLPPTLGFLAKLVVFSALADAASAAGTYAFYALLLFGLFNAAIALYYYLRPVYMMIVRDPAEKSVPFSYHMMSSLLLSYFSFTLVYLFFKAEVINEWLIRVF